MREIEKLRIATMTLIEKHGGEYVTAHDQAGRDKLGTFYKYQSVYIALANQIHDGVEHAPTANWDNFFPHQRSFRPGSKNRALEILKKAKGIDK